MDEPRFGVTDPEVLKAGLRTLVVCVCTPYSRVLQLGLILLVYTPKNNLITILVDTHFY